MCPLASYIFFLSISNPEEYAGKIKINEEEISEIKKFSEQELRKLIHDNPENMVPEHAFIFKNILKKQQ